MKKTLLSTTLIAIMISGCAGQYKNGSYIPSPDEVGDMLKPKVSKEQSINRSQDKHLTKSFIENFKTSRDTKMRIKHSSIEIEKVIATEDAFIKVSQAESFYKGKASTFLSDDIATVYKNAVKQRGNYVNVYKGQMNYKIFETIIGRLNKGDKDKMFAYSLDYALIEFDASDQMQSALVRAAIVVPSALGQAMNDRNPPVQIEQNSIIFFKEKVQACEMTIPNNDFTNYLVKSLK